MDRRRFLKRSIAAISALSISEGFSIRYGYADRNERINRLMNKENPSVLEQKHVPQIEVPTEVESNEWFDVKVNVGFMKEHPSTAEHWITWIKLLVDGQGIAMTRYRTGGIGAPQARFRIRFQRSATIEAMEHCNIHGTWISEPVKIRVI